MGHDFYATTYGGFAEEAEDKEFAYQSPNDEDDAVDSDFSIDENDEPRSDLEDEAKAGEDGKGRPKRGQGVQTKAYKEPKRGEQGGKTAVKAEAPPPPAKIGAKEVRKTVRPVKTVSKPVKAGFRPEMPMSVGGGLGGRRKLTRATTVTKTAETAKRQKEAAAKHRKLIKRRAQLAAARKDEMRPLTQAEILEEAKITEKLNAESLKRFRELELEAKKKANRSAGARVIKGHYVRYISTAMPLIEEVQDAVDDTEDTVEVDDTVGHGTSSIIRQKENEISKSPANKRHERTFVTFSDFETFRDNFPAQSQTGDRTGSRGNRICPITRVPAKYFDPVTQMPYANPQAFRILREAYYSQLELKGDRNDPEVAQWLEWREKTKGNAAGGGAAKSSGVTPGVAAAKETGGQQRLLTPRQSSTPGSAVGGSVQSTTSGSVLTSMLTKAASTPAAPVTSIASTGMVQQHPPQGAAAAVTVQAASSTAAAAVTARGLSPLAMALRQQLQLQALAPGGSVVSTLPIGASPVIQQQQVVSVAGVQGGRGGAGGQMQQSVVLPVRTTPLAGATGTATHTTGTFPITQVIQNTGGTGGGVTAPGATAAAIQTVKIGGQQVGIPRTMTTTTLTPQQLQQLSASGGRAGGQVLSAASIQNALRSGAVAVRQSPAGTTQLITRAPVGATAMQLRPQTVTT